MIDLLIAAVIGAAAYWGYREGLSTLALALIGFAVGALIGSRVAPLALDGGFEDPFAPVLALPAALLIGALLAAGLERVGFNLRIRVRRRSTPDLVGGTVVAVCVGLVTVWIVGALLARIDSLRDPIRDSAIIEGLNSALPPPGPVLDPEEPPRDPLPLLVGPQPNVGPTLGNIGRNEQIRAASQSVVKLRVDACGSTGRGTGWIARDGIVVTNAHVVEGGGSGSIEVQVRGEGDGHTATTIWYDELNDLAILRVPGVSGVPPLKIDPSPEAGTYVALLGFPGGGPYRVTPGRLGNTTFVPEEDRTITTLRATGASPGSSGGPVVDRKRRVSTMVFAGRDGGRAAYGVPNRFIRRALRRAGPPVTPGEC